MKRVRVYLSGVVQGVFFRAATRRAASDLNLTGWVRNMDDGRVEAVFEGTDANVNKMLVWCKIGPPAAKVENVTMTEEHYTGGFEGFSIKHL
ncbi:MAG: acylphosphatase [Smithellaceae bacterium]